MVIDGYKLGTKDIWEAEEKIKAIKGKIDLLSEKTYHALLSEEVSFLCDCVALGILQRDPNMSVWEGAILNVDQKIRQANMRNIKNKYNLSVFIQIIPYEEDIYLRVLCENRNLLKAFKTLENYSLTEEECMDSGNQKRVVWDKIQKSRKSLEPMTINLSTQRLNPNQEKLKFPTKEERVKLMARYNAQNRFLSYAANGEEIPPHLLMRCFDDMLEIFSKNNYVLIEEETRLRSILPELDNNSEYIFTSEAQKQAEEAEKEEEQEEKMQGPSCSLIGENIIS